ncbi:PorT family protein [Echinicola strongylocentroti]|uniref:PorT family protein n=1 Tax=Echinicola strongylocentroti TaxID=1795355 RepID=A0A2Z4IJB4_9BACT|nr:porin family protein [Echinicola strongylocentroti]AWW30995.1 PorT family protein [Echinicola strongylocentroti]
MMKKYLYACLLLFVSTMFFSSLSNAQVQWGVRAGMNMANSKFTQADGSVEETDPVVRMQIGLTLDVPVWNNIYLQPSLIYQGKGFKGMGIWPALAEEDSEFKVNLSYLVMPIHVVFKPKLGSSGHLLVGAGPYIGYGLGGKWESESDLLYDDIMLAQRQGDVNFTKDGSVGEMGAYNYGEPWDYGIGFLLGYEFMERYSVQVNGDFGMADLQYKYGDYDTGQELKNLTFGVSFGYKF